MPTLDWLNRAEAFTTAAKVPYRLLETVSEHAPSVLPDSSTVRPELVEGQKDNLLIQGDNLKALKALLPFYRTVGVLKPRCKICLCFLEIENVD
jgi:adenine-specific DNA-methyltransferase